MSRALTLFKTRAVPRLWLKPAPPHKLRSTHAISYNYQVLMGHERKEGHRGNTNYLLNSNAATAVAARRDTEIGATGNRHVCLHLALRKSMELSQAAPVPRATPSFRTPYGAYSSSRPHRHSFSARGEKCKRARARTPTHLSLKSPRIVSPGAAGNSPLNKRGSPGCLDVRVTESSLDLYGRIYLRLSIRMHVNVEVKNMCVSVFFSFYTLKISTFLFNGIFSVSTCSIRVINKRDSLLYFVRTAIRIASL